MHPLLPAQIHIKSNQLQAPHLDMKKVEKMKMKKMREMRENEHYVSLTSDPTPDFERKQFVTSTFPTSRS